MNKNLFLRLCLILTVLLSTFSCRQDILPEQENYHNTSAFQLTSKRISLTESKHKAQLFPEVQNAEAKFKAFAKSNASGKVVNYENGVSIDTESVIYIENGSNFHTYTFNIKRENAPETASLENLLLIPETDGRYKEFLVTYNLTPQEREKIRNGEPVNTKGKTTITELAKGSYNSGGQLAKMSCNWTEETIWQGCSHVVNGVSMHNQSNVSEWPSCKADVKPSVYTVITGGCNMGELPEHIAPVDGGSGPGGGAGGNGPDPCTTVAGNPSEVGIINEFGCNTGAPTQPNVKPSQKYPCEQLESLGKKQYFKDRMDDLKDNVDNGTQEFGFVLHENNSNPISYLLMGSSQNDTNAIDYGTYYQSLSNDMANSLYGNAHNHLKSDTTHVGIFAPFDLNSIALFGTIETLPQSTFYSPVPKKAVTYVITDIGLFALKIKDINKLKAFVINYSGWSKKDKDDYLEDTFQNKKKYNIRHNSTHDEQVTGFLRFINDQDIGIELYEGNKDTYQSWKKLELVNNGNGNFSFNEIPCNL